MFVIFIGFMYCLMFLVSGSDLPAFEDEGTTVLLLFSAILGLCWPRSVLRNVCVNFSIDPGETEYLATIQGAPGMSQARQFAVYTLLMAYSTLSSIILLNLLIGLCAPSCFVNKCVVRAEQP